MSRRHGAYHGDGQGIPEELTVPDLLFHRNRAAFLHSMQHREQVRFFRDRPQMLLRQRIPVMDLYGPAVGSPSHPHQVDRRDDVLNSSTYRPRSSPPAPEATTPSPSSVHPRSDSQVRAGPSTPHEPMSTPEVAKALRSLQSDTSVSQAPVHRRQLQEQWPGYFIGEGIPVGERVNGYVMGPLPQYVMNKRQRLRALPQCETMERPTYRSGRATTKPYHYHPYHSRKSFPRSQFHGDSSSTQSTVATNQVNREQATSARNDFKRGFEEAFLSEGREKPRSSPGSVAQENAPDFRFLELLSKEGSKLAPLPSNEEKEKKGVHSSEGCSCPKSRCLKLYCECFRDGFKLCGPKCTCLNCLNTIEESGPRGRRIVAMKSLLDRNPQALHKQDRSSVRARESGDPICHCVKSRCLKKYCECFSVAKTCNSSCACNDCCNTEEESIPGGKRNLALRNHLAKDPAAFSRGSKKLKTPISTGCSCKNNRCLLKYCACFKAGVRCLDSCKCFECRNVDLIPS